jgi:N-acetylglutamate synthase-like GNAT family acetyltransferase
MWDELVGSMRQWLRMIGSSSPGARVIERDSVTASVVPVAPEHAVVNSALYADADGLAAAYDHLAATYAETAAVWMVWVSSTDHEARAALERAGHVLDVTLPVMAMDLDGIGRPPAGTLEDWTAEGDLREIGPLNDRAYALETDSFTRAFANTPDDLLRAYVARIDGRAAGCLTVIDHNGNADVESVAVLPEARGRGISGKLLAHALADARERGIETSTLVATDLGRPVYERLGYREFGTVEMWVRRPTPA